MNIGSGSTLQRLTSIVPNASIFTPIFPDPGVGEVTPAQSFRISILGIVDTHYNWFDRFGSPRATIKLNKASICIGIEKLDNIGSDSGRALSSTYAAPFKLLIFGC